MSTGLEDRLRAALEERAAEIPAASRARMTAHDYHPRASGLRARLPRRRPLALAGMAGVAGAAAAVVSLVGGAAPAFAGWSARPTAPAAGQLATAAAACQKQSSVDGLPLVVSDTRGPFTFSIYAGARDSMTCITGPSLTAVQGSRAAVPVRVPAGQVQLSTAPGIPGGAGSYSFADGRTGAGVTGVTLELSGGGNVVATVQNGWYAAWWPGSETVKAAEVSTASGKQTQTADAGCGAPVCSGGASGFGAGSASGSGAGRSTSASAGHARVSRAFRVTKR